MLNEKKDFCFMADSSMKIPVSIKKSLKPTSQMLLQVRDGV